MGETTPRTSRILAFPQHEYVQVVHEPFLPQLTPSLTKHIFSHLLTDVALLSKKTGERFNKKGNCFWLQVFSGARKWISSAD